MCNEWPGLDCVFRNLYETHILSRAPRHTTSHVRRLYTHAHARTPTHPHPHTHAHTYTHTHTHIRSHKRNIHLYIFIYTYIYVNIHAFQAILRELMALYSNTGKFHPVFPPCIFSLRAYVFPLSLPFFFPPIFFPPISVHFHYLLFFHLFVFPPISFHFLCRLHSFLFPVLLSLQGGQDA